MGVTKKHAKGRLDKFYHLAKEQGYRARSAFKLIQLNKKYNFLEKSKCAIDLCAAPGGWLQVCVKYMPKPNIIIGVDLEKIKPIPGVITHVEDITTPSCRTTIKRDLKTWKADVVMHDGAPNVGVSWAQDAFTQSELTLSACKLATEFLVPGGTFVTKVFRSKDYNKLMWVFNQLFGKVEATKPTASRNVSAEIFVVCRDYLAPKKIDPRLLDPKFAFKEMDDQVPEEESLKKIKEKQGAVLNDLFHPEKRRRQREGYEDGDYTLHVKNDLAEFIKSPDFLGILSRSSAFVFGEDEFSQKIKNSKLTTEEILEYLSDLKVLGKKEFKQLIKWRDSVRVMMDLVPKKVEKVVEEEPEEEMDIEDIIQNEKETMEQKMRKLKKKQRERKAKQLLKLKLGMETPADIGIEGQSDMGALPDIDFGEEETKEHLKVKKEKEQAIEEEDDESVFDDSDDELERKIGRLDAEMDTLYEQYEKIKLEKNPSAKVKKVKEASQAFEEWYGLESDKKIKSKSKEEYNSDISDSSSSEDEGELSLPANKRPFEGEEPLSKKAKLFFDNPIFESTKDKFEDSLFDDELVMKPKKTKKKKTEDLDSDEEKESKGFEIVPLEKDMERPESDDESDGGNIIDSAAAYTLAQKMVTKSGKRDLIDDSFNRYAFNDPEDLPAWFMQDESRHNKPTMPVTKEAVEIMRQQMRALDARPIKKIAEAKWRKQLRTQRRLEKAAKKSEGLANQEDLSEKTKLEQASKVMSKAKSKGKSEKPQVKVVVAKGAYRGVQGRPKGVKGRYKMVDGTMKKEKRALKRKEQKNKKRRK
ncbi:AdoMet-dependent rRNA methyltransferase spb1 [Boothiomyces macroporosus]|uniref:AdoMet-dependent rRNA methyltransferase spb1 n=1 Tax=Boothiomyces macroporosus TaxID=261099 RepID=A0AAD5UQ18_9FUNG|nr:AdoMet-dependent rRNA methyltransferase spb1 [Boothiomyces macroporosus]KAJ3260695.1 AdoMet-dependent rRNA methyltransferase spb1 [Boothiomyces macroporosus]